MNKQQARSGIFISFNRPIEIDPCTALMAKLSEVAYNSPNTTVHLLISSTGGSLVSGLTVFNFLQALPLNIVTVNHGQVGSIANLVFLAGSERIVIPGAHFFFHDFTWSTGMETIPTSVLTERVLQIDAFKGVYLKALKERTKVFDGTGQPFDPFKPSIMYSGAASASGYASERTLKIPATAELIWVI